MVRKTICFDEFGKQKFYIIGYFPKYTDAMEALINFNRSGQPINSTYTFKEIYDALIKDRFTDQGKKPSPIYPSQFNKSKDLWEMKFVDIKLSTIEKIMMEKATTPTMKRDFKTLMNQMYKYARRHDIVKTNIAEMLTTPTIPKSTRHTAFSKEELTLIWNHKDELPVQLWLTYCYTGMRPSELISVLSANVHLNERYLIGGMKTEAGTNRTIPIAECIVPFMERFLSKGSEYLVSKDTGEQYQYTEILYLLTEFCSRHGMNHSPHDGRHTCATYLDMMNVSISTIQNILGHASNVIVSKIYIHKQLPTMIEAINRIPTFGSQWR